MNKNGANILLINPPQTFYPGSQPFCKSFPLGIAYIAAMLDQEGFSVDILDTLITNFEAKETDGVKHYGMSWDRLAEEISKRRPRIVGISCPFTTQIENALQAASIAKKTIPQPLVIIGGPDPTVRPLEILSQTRDVDIAVIGEGEFSFLEIVKRAVSDDLYTGEPIKGIAFRQGADTVLNPKRDYIENLDELPFPAYHLFDMERYLDPEDEYLYPYHPTKGRRELSMITSRGCPFNCVFCSVNLHMGRKWRAHSVEYVLNHLRHVTERYGVGYIHFDDDNLTLDMKRFSAVLDGMNERGMDVFWDTPNGVRADNLDRDILIKMKENGCQNLALAIESGSQDVLSKVIGKPLRLERVVESVKLCHEVGIRVIGFYVIGFPGEALEDIHKTISFSEMLRDSYKVIPGLMAATPLYGTRLYDICREHGYFAQEPTPRALSEATQPHGRSLIRTDDFSPEDVREAFCMAEKGSSEKPNG